MGYCCQHKLRWIAGVCGPAADSGWSQWDLWLAGTHRLRTCSKTKAVLAWYLHVSLRSCPTKPTIAYGSLMPGFSSCPAPFWCFTFHASNRPLLEQYMNFSKNVVEYHCCQHKIQYCLRGSQGSMGHSQMAAYLTSDLWLLWDPASPEQPAHLVLYRSDGPVSHWDAAPLNPLWGSA